MRISCDLDGVLADMDGALGELGKDLFASADAAAGLSAARSAVSISTVSTVPSAASALPASQASPASPARTWRDLSARRHTRLWQRVRKESNFWESLKECEPGEVRRLQQLAQQHRWEVVFLTQRPATEGRTPQEQSQRWLRRHGYELPAVCTTQGSRGRIVAVLAVDAHIDDRLEHCVEVANDSKAWPLLVWRDDESIARVTANAKKQGIAVVRTVADALTRLAEVSAAS